VRQSHQDFSGSIGVTNTGAGPSRFCVTMNAHSSTPCARRCHFSRIRPKSRPRPRGALRSRSGFRYGEGYGHQGRVGSV
ncbi:hypothetical protein E4U43_002381, partial [Claviceps pusilla]